MAKMFYTNEEAAARLNISTDQLKQMVSENKLREFRDGARVMFKVDQVDKLASEMKSGSSAAPSAGDSGIALASDSAHGQDVISLADSDIKPAAKEDTVVTGASGAPATPVFDSGEIKMADSSAQTQIQPALEDQLSLEGVGSGSGLLDLTRESDDTSLGAELLDEIYPGGDQKQESGIGSASGIFEQSGTGSPADTTSGPSGLEHMETAAAPVAVGPVEIVEAPDPSSGAFGATALAAMLVMGLGAVAVLAAYYGFNPDWINWVNAATGNLAIFTAILVVVSGLFAGVGYFVGRARTS